MNKTIFVCIFSFGLSFASYASVNLDQEAIYNAVEVEHHRGEAQASQGSQGNETAEPDFDPRTPESIRGVDSDGDGLRDSYKAAVLSTYQRPEVIEIVMFLGREY
uniref:hypothetical protein n=1 Tax=Thaumasiovibrio occultus TaxID=1891184 RepID=UPI00131CC001